jgi:hypothetical protein
MRNLLGSLLLFSFFSATAAWAGDEPVLNAVQAGNLADAREALGQIATGYTGNLQATPSQVDYFQKMFRLDQSMEPLTARYRCVLAATANQGIKVLYAGVMSAEDLRAARALLGSKNYGDQMAALMQANPAAAAKLEPISTLTKLVALYDQTHPLRRASSLSVPELAAALGTITTERFGVQVSGQIFLYDLAAERLMPTSPVLKNPAALDALLKSVAAPLSSSSKVDLAQLVGGNLRSTVRESPESIALWRAKESSALRSLGFSTEPAADSSNDARARGTTSTQATNVIHFTDASAPGTQYEIGLAGVAPVRVSGQVADVFSQLPALSGQALPASPHVVQVDDGVPGRSIFFGHDKAGAEVAGVIQTPAPPRAPVLPNLAEAPATLSGLNTTVDLGRGGHVAIEGQREKKEVLGRNGSAVKGGVTAAVPISGQGTLEVHLLTTVNSRPSDTQTLVDPLGEHSDMRHAAQAKANLGPMTATVGFESQNGDVSRVDNRSKNQVLKFATTYQTGAGQLELQAEASDTRTGQARQNVVKTGAAYSHGEALKTGILYASTRSLNSGVATSEQRVEWSTSSQINSAVGIYKVEATVGAVLGSASSPAGAASTNSANRTASGYGRVEVKKGAYTVSASHDQLGSNTVLLVYKVSLQ